MNKSINKFLADQNVIQSLEQQSDYLFKCAGVKLRLMTTRIFLFVFLRDQNSQHFNEDLLAVNASAFRFVLCFKAIYCAGASN